MELTHTAVRSAKLLSILRQELAMSSTLVKRLKFSHAYTVNGTEVHTDFLVQPGDVIRVRLDEPTPEYPAEDAPMDILYEDDDLIAVDKPVGMLIHPSSARNVGTLANRLAGYYQRTGQPCAVHPVSRLDRDTFGVVLFSKNSHVHAKMSALTHARAITKVYHAAVFGAPSADSGIIDAPIAREAPQRMLRCIREDGKEARSAYRVLERGLDCSKLELHPLTGRTHQLRLHCLYAGFPILGDPQYSTPEAAAFSGARGLMGQQLCAVSLEFRHPITGEPVIISSNQDVSLDFSPITDI